MKRTAGAAAVVLLAWTCAGPQARADWVGDIIYCANARYQTTTASTYAYGVAVTYADFRNGFVGGGATVSGDVGYVVSEPLAQNDSNWEERDVVWNARAIVKYDDDTALMLCALRWTTGLNNVWLTQLEYRPDQDYEDDGGPGLINIANNALDATGGMLSGRLQLAVAPEGGYDELDGYGGTRLRLPALEASGLVRSENVWDMTVDQSGNLYIAGRTGGLGLDFGSVWRVPKGNLNRSLGPAHGQRVGDVGVFGTPTEIVSKQTFVSRFTGIAVDDGYLFVVDRGMGTLDVYKTTGTPDFSIDVQAAMGLIPEAVRVDPTYTGLGTRVILNVLDPNLLDKILVLNINLAMQTWSVAARLQSSGLRENGDLQLNRIDWIEVSPGGDIFYVDSRDTGDARHAMISATDYAMALAIAGGGVALVNVVGVDVFNDRTSRFGRGATFMAPVAGPVLPTPVLLSTDPPADGTLPKTQNNVIRLEFDGPLYGVLHPPLSIVPVGGGLDLALLFNYSVTPPLGGQTLVASENTAVLTNRVWYRIRPAAGLNVDPFEFDLVKLEGDADNSGQVLGQDYFSVKKHLFEMTDARYDLDGSGQVLGQDYVVVKNHLFQAKPPKP